MHGMELTLNLIWLTLALIAFAIVLPAAAASRERRHRKIFVLTGGIALLCVLALLFPIISVSDDLSADRDATEESNTLRRTIAAVGHHHELPLSKQFAQFVAVLITMLFAALLAAIARVDLACAPAYALLVTRFTDPRSPPRR